MNPKVLFEKFKAEINSSLSSFLGFTAMYPILSPARLKSLENDVAIIPLSKMELMKGCSVFSYSKYLYGSSLIT